jgi:hypothetical protein
VAAVLAVFYRSTIDKVNAEHTMVEMLGQGGYMILGVMFFAVMMFMLYRLAYKKS